VSLTASLLLFALAQWRVAYYAPACEYPTLVGHIIPVPNFEDCHTLALQGEEGRRVVCLAPGDEPPDFSWEPCAP